MKIVYTDYAEATLIERRISKKEVEDTLLNPSEIVDGKHDRKMAQKRFGNKLLRVIFEIHANAYIVITTYFTKAERHIKNADNF